MANASDRTRASIRVFVDFVFMRMEAGEMNVAEGHDAMLNSMYRLAEGTREAQSFMKAVMAQETVSN
jgi:hypothetical protein